MNAPTNDTGQTTKDFDNARRFPDTFILLHLAISRGLYEKNKRNGVYKASPQTKEGVLGIERKYSPESEDFLFRLQKGGHPYGWDKREKYQPRNKNHIDSMMKDSKTRLFRFTLDDEEIGFCLVTGLPPHKETSQNTQGISKEQAIDMFRDNRQLSSNTSAIEINKIALYPEFTNKGYGNYFLAKLLDILIIEEQNDIVYLNTRDTNHDGVPRFYYRNGVEVFTQENLISDLIEGDAPEWEVKTTSDPTPNDQPNLD